MQDIGLWAGFILTLMVFSYLLGDNFLYRLAVYIFVGLSAGFIAIVTVESVLLPWFKATMLSGNPGGIIIGLIPLLLGFLLLFKSSPHVGAIGNLAIAVLIGIGTAVAIVGAVSGTLIPLTSNAAASADGNMLNMIIAVIGVICSLMYFQYLARRTRTGAVVRGPLNKLLSSIGQGFIVVTLGALYAAAILTSLTIFSERIAYLLTRVSGG
jgi:hypothetical protein